MLNAIISNEYEPINEILESNERLNQLVTKIKSIDKELFMSDIRDTNNKFGSMEELLRLEIELANKILLIKSKNTVNMWRYNNVRCKKITRICPRLRRTKEKKPN